MTDPRRLAVTALLKVNTNDGYSNLVLDEQLKNSRLDGADRAFAAALFYGTLEKKLTLDYFISSVSDKGTRLSPFVREVLRCAAYQIMYMDKIPDSAAVNEAVGMVKASRENRAAGLVNRLLRRICDNKTELVRFADDDEGLSLKYSAPLWLFKNISADYGRDNAKAFFEKTQGSPPVYIRVNTLQTTPEELLLELEKQGIKAEKTLLPAALKLTRPGDTAGNPLFKDGLFFVEDLASQLCAEVLDPEPYERVLDLCAAPGGKSFAAALKMENEGELISCDIYESRTGLIRQGAGRLGLDIIKPTVNDGAKSLPGMGFDAVLCDVPCSGFGIIRRKPDIKYKDPDELKSLPPLQLSILENGAKAVKKGGRLVYSTCTLRRSENQRIAEKFLKNHPEFVQERIALNGVKSATDDGYLTLMGENDTDGFFVALFRRI